jgi:hypothetical protein
MRRPSLGILAVVLMLAGVAAFAVPAGGKKGGPSNAKGAAKAALFAQLSGRNEIGADGKRGAGDTDGVGSFTGLITSGQLCFGITVNSLDTPSLAHVHAAKKGRNGPIVIPLTPPTNGDPGASSGCTSVAPDLLAAIRKHPQRYYANVHTNLFPGGAVRGQLFHAKPGQAK